MLVIGVVPVAQDPQSAGSRTDCQQDWMAALPAPCSLTLGALYSRQPQAGEDGQLQPIDATTRIKPEEGLELLRLARDLQAGALLEIGLAYGFSTQFLLASLVPRGGAAGGAGSLSEQRLAWRRPGPGRADGGCPEP